MQPHSLPTSTRAVTGRRVLVLAPHQDDELLACGGLLHQLRNSGSEIQVVFLTDSAGDAPSGESPSYTERREQEGQLVQEANGWRVTRLGLPDGKSEAHFDQLRTRVADLLRDERPDLVLSPGPQELSADHRAAARALYEAIHSDLGESELDPALRVLFCEINRPCNPNVLVDVTDDLVLLRHGMELYASQQERHDYLNAALGLRRFRALSLPPEVESAEAFVLLDLERLRTIDWTSIVVLSGGESQSRVSAAERPTISVILRTKDRPVLLREALASLASGVVAPDEVVLVNDGGSPVDVGDDWPFQLLRVDHETCRGRAAAANSGVAACTREAVGFLDDDDLVLAEHYQLLGSALANGGFDVVYSDAAVVSLALDDQTGQWSEQERRRPYSRDFDADLLLVDNYIPFHTLLISRTRFEEVGPFDESLDWFEDWDFLIRLSRRTEFRRLDRVTCEYRHFLDRSDHALAGKPDADRAARFLERKAQVLGKHQHHLDAQTLSRVVISLRRDIVQALEQRRGAGRELCREREHFLARSAALQARIEEELLRRRAWDVERSALRREQDLLRERSVELREELRASHEDARALQEDRDRIRADLRDTQAQLRERDDQLRSQYAYAEELVAVGRTRQEQVSGLETEIQRLREQVSNKEALVARMESTRAWALHRALERLRGKT